MRGPQGVVETLLMHADSEEQAALQACAQGLSVLSAKAVVAQATVALRGADLAWWCQELKTLLRAGMTVVEALETLELHARGEEGEKGVRRLVQTRLLERLRRGDALSQAMDDIGGFPPVLRASVQAAERTRGLADALDDYLQYHEVLTRLRRRVISAAMYPAMVCAVGLAIVVFLLVVVMPRFAGVLADSPGASIGASGGLLLMSRWLSEHLMLASGFLALLFGGLVWFGLQGGLQRWALSLAQQVPPVAKALHQFELAKLYQSLAVLFKGGFPIEHAVQLCQQSVGRPEWQARLAQCQQGLLRGEGVAQALADSGLTDDVSRRLLAVGERSGGFETVLKVIADRHAQAFGDFVDRLMRLVEPLLLLLVSVVVGGVVVLMYLPIFDIATGLQR